MTVKELIEKLQKYPENQRVLVSVEDENFHAGLVEEATLEEQELLEFEEEDADDLVIEDFVVIKAL
jgi:TusA-related sulfurtransferase